MQMYLSKVKIREAMDRQRIKTYTELAEQLGITKNQLSVMLSDDYNPLKTRVEDLCQLLSVAPNEIMDFSTDTKGIDTSMIRNDDVTAIELFAGAGGLALGLEKAGIKTVEHVEFDKACCETLRTNRPNWNVICDDIHNVDFTQFRDKVDIVTGGFPCQGVVQRFLLLEKSLDSKIQEELCFTNLLAVSRKLIQRYLWLKMYEG